MKNIIVKLDCGNHAIIQQCGINKMNNVRARIGIILPNTRYMDFLNLDNWKATYKGKSQNIKTKLIKIYNQNKQAIRKNVLSLFE